MAVVTMRQLLESGVHFGHQTRRWNPKMKRFIFTERNGIYIIDLQQSLSYIDRAYDFIKETVAHGGTILFVGTKKQAQEPVAEQATRVGMPYVNQRWLGGMLTNFQTVSKRLQRLKELDEVDFDDVAKSGMTKKELLVLRRERDKLEKTLGGIRDMARVPSAVWIVDTKKEHLAVDEARKLGIPVVAILDTNCDPDEVDYKIPGNDDAIRSVTLLTRVVADAVADGPHGPLARRRRQARGRHGRRRRAAGRVGARTPRGRSAPAAAPPPSVEPAPRPRSAAEAAVEPRPPRRRRGARRRRRRDHGDEQIGALSEPIATDAMTPDGVPAGEAVEAAGHRPGLSAAPTRTDDDDTKRRDSTMANFTAADVKRLRDRTGAGMMDCKKALDEADGDFDKADRDPADQGRGEGREARCRPHHERRPRRRPRRGRRRHPRRDQQRDGLRRQGEPFVQLADRVLDQAVRIRAADAEALLGSEIEPGKTVRDLLTEANATIGEKIEVRRVARLEAPHVVSYLHRTSPDLPPQIGVLLATDADADGSAIAKDVAMHIAAMQPAYLTRDEVPADVVASERRIAEETAREEGKPEQALPRIVEGRVNGFFKDNVLLEQPFAKENKKTVQQVLKEAGVNATGFARFKVGA